MRSAWSASATPGSRSCPPAGTDPPGLAAIAPMSPTDDLFSTGYPGGIYNDGFAASWVSARIDDAKAAASYRNGHLVRSSGTPVADVGQPWTYYEIDAELVASRDGTSTCLANQALHNQSEGLVHLVGPAMVAPGVGPGRSAYLFNPRSMTVWASHITVPVFLSGALQDEQTGPQWPALIDAIPKTTPLFANMVNGNHIDSTDPQTMSRWLEFLDIYVARTVPTQPGVLAAEFLDKFAAFASGISSQAPLPAIRFTQAPNVATAKAEFAGQTPLIRALFDNGAGAAGPGATQSTYSADFSSWPPAGSTETLHFGADGSLGPAAPTAKSGTTFTLDPGARPLTSLPPSGNAWAADPGWNWTPVPAADGIAFQTAPFTSATTIVGPATLDLWVKASTPVEDFQATITEVRPSIGPGGVRHLGVPAKRRPGRQSRLDVVVHRSHLYRRRRQEPVVHRIHPGQGPDRSDRPHLPARHRAAGGHLGSGRRPADLGVRHPRPRPAQHGRYRWPCRFSARGRPRERGASHLDVTGVQLPARGAVPRLSGRDQPVGSDRLIPDRI